MINVAGTAKRHVDVVQYRTFVSAENIMNLIVSHARAELPNEACGLIARHVTDNPRVVDKV
jgi:hypothetical protein